MEEQDDEMKYIQEIFFKLDVGSRKSDFARLNLSKVVLPEISQDRR